MSAFTQTDLDNVNAAITALLTGEREVSVSVAGRSVTYQSTSLSALRELRHEIKNELASAAGKSRTWLPKGSRKGL